MPIPFILLGVAALAGGYGVKKGFDAKSDFNRADSLNSEAKEIYDDACKSLDKCRNKVQQSITNLGELKFHIYETQIIPFVETYQKIKNIDFANSQLNQEFNLNGISQNDILSIQKSALDMKNIVGGGVTALGAGGLAGLATYGSVGVLASTAGGTAIGGLTGVAATNATLAWLGGGSLAAGGFGMAGGMAVLGGIVAGPVLAIGGMMMASKAEEAKHNAYSNRDKASLAAEQMETAETMVNGIDLRFNEISEVLKKLSTVFTPFLHGIQNIVENNTNYKTYSNQEKEGIMVAAMLTKTLKNILEAPLLDKEGNLTPVSGEAVEIGRNQIYKIQNT